MCRNDLPIGARRKRLRVETQLGHVEHAVARLPRFALETRHERGQFGLLASRSFECLNRQRNFIVALTVRHIARQSALALDTSPAKLNQICEAALAKGTFAIRAHGSHRRMEHL